ncbi:hypothetical protein K505DRAFT_252118 [Melanomma pulvis-pyrius CBS 109.77]|uniref:Uncharacterized protein n=1 Tax=Melanomma pulvis-pyrius CBS 109.77 TaxID=1314802 RepID=A0A6A6X0Y0_9PLEO|nr:hypothetical protein K505DRAFT_252118 [Melanomma pulvis-pyrius CBS 109.77]
MCKVVQFTFECGHHLKLRKSRCLGKVSKQRKIGPKAACCAEAYLTTKLSFDCGECQQILWEKAWNYKLERAKEFQSHLVKAGLPGAYKVSQEINNMEQEHSQEAWNIRQKFPPIHKVPIERVEPSTETQRESNLRKEVRPEDVVVVDQKREEANDDGEGFWTSTDSFQDQSLALHNTDSSWVDNFLAPQDTELPESPGDGFDFGSNAWDWSDHGEDSSETPSDPSFDRMRHELLDYKLSDPDKYYRHWLRVCRMERQHFEDVTGRVISLPGKGG